MIVVFDSGIWISSFNFGGTPLRVVDEVLSNHQVAICKEIVLEVEKTLTAKFRWPRRKVNEDWVDT